MSTFKQINFDQSKGSNQKNTFQSYNATALLKENSYGDSVNKNFDTKTTEKTRKFSNMDENVMKNNNTFDNSIKSSSKARQFGNPQNSQRTAGIR